MYSFYSQANSGDEGHIQLHEVDISHSFNTGPGTDVTFEQPGKASSSNNWEEAQKKFFKELEDDERAHSSQLSTNDSNSPPSKIQVSQREILGKRRRGDENLGEIQYQKDPPNYNDFDPSLYSFSPASTKVDLTFSLSPFPDLSDLDFEGLEKMKLPFNTTNQIVTFENLIAPLYQDVLPTNFAGPAYEGVPPTNQDNVGPVGQGFDPTHYAGPVYHGVPPTYQGAGTVPMHQKSPPTDQVVAFTDNVGPVDQGFNPINYANPVYHGVPPTGQGAVFNNEIVPLYQGIPPANQVVALNDHVGPVNQGFDPTNRDIAFNMNPAHLYQGVPLINQDVVFIDNGPPVYQGFAPINDAVPRDQVVPPINQVVAFNNHAGPGNQDPPPANPDHALHNYGAAVNNQNDGAPLHTRQNEMKNHQNAVASRVRKQCQRNKNTRRNTPLFERSTVTLDDAEKERFRNWVLTSHKQTKTWAKIKTFLNTNLDFGEIFVDMVSLFLSEEFRGEYEESLRHGQLPPEAQEFLRDDTNKAFYAEKFVLNIRELQGEVENYENAIKSSRRTLGL